MPDQPQSEDRAAALAGEQDAASDSPGERPAGFRRGDLLGYAWVRRYGGHPVAVRIGARVYGRRLFVGGRERTMRLPRMARARPAVDVIVNLCDLADHPSVTMPSDLWWPRGEGPLGYRPDDLLRDATAVADLLRRGETVLVHCMAGVNRAPTLCAAVLMLLERCSAREALRRVRQHRWIAFPDPWHWRTLRQLEARLADLADAHGGTKRPA
jgi:predicted protein tyrosine phosphatase